MGNCQAAEAATVVIEHPGGRVERLYWPTAAAEVMRSNPGHHVALVTLCRAEERSGGGGGSVRVTRVKLLKPKDLLLIGQVYRLITTQVTRALKARKYEKMKKAQSEQVKQQQQQQQENRRVVVDEQGVELNGGGGEIDSHNYDQVAAMHERDRQKGVTAQSAARSRQWRPSLQSISEAAS